MSGDSYRPDSPPPGIRPPLSARFVDGPPRPRDEPSFARTLSPPRRMRDSPPRFDRPSRFGRSPPRRNGDSYHPAPNERPPLRDLAERMGDRAHPPLADRMERDRPPPRDMDRGPPPRVMMDRRPPFRDMMPPRDMMDRGPPSRDLMERIRPREFAESMSAFPVSEPIVQKPFTESFQQRSRARSP